MAKLPAKKTTATNKKAAVKKSKTKPSAIDVLEKASVEILKKFQSLGIEQQLQADLEWCLGSYLHDKNPTGLLSMISQSITVLKAEQIKNKKDIPAKMITDLEKILNARK